MKRRKKKPVNTGTKTYVKKEVRKLKNKLLKLWAYAVKERAGFKCELCGFPGDKKLKLNSHHIEHYNTSIALRYDKRNGLCADAGCHKFRKKSAHRSFLTLYNYLTVNRMDDLEYLLQQYNLPNDRPWLEKPLNEMNMEELNLFKNYLKELIMEYENER